MREKQVAIELKGISKSFGDVSANKHIDFKVYKGEILALLGENGSGKTTLMNMLSGIYKPDSGSIYINEKEVAINSPEDSKRLGIGMVHQHFKLVDKFSAADNIWLGVHKESFFLTKKRYDKVKQISLKFGFDIDVKKKVYEMSVSEKQTVEIIKVLYYGAEILILDEPTAVLTYQEAKKLFGILRKMREAGHAIIIITHKLNEVMEISDRVTILRKGENVGTVITRKTNAAELTAYMVGKKITLSIDRPHNDYNETILEVLNLNLINEEGVKAIDNLSFYLKRGEILGVAGISGSGQKELCESIAGLYKINSGKILYKKENIEGKSPREIINLGISMSFIPEDRLGMGLAASLSITDNMMLKNYNKDKRYKICVNRKKARELAEKIVNKLSISTPSINTPVRKLSGGNVQKVLVGREIEQSPNIIVTAYPVRGLDINSSYTIYNILNEQKQKGVAILYVGEDLDVMLELCDRIMVLCHGKLTGTVMASAVTKADIGLLMTNDMCQADIEQLEFLASEDKGGDSNE